MTEKRLVIDALELNYKGLLSIHSLLKEIDKVSAELGYGKNEKRRVELVKPDGKEFSIELRPTKRKSEYFFLMIKIRMSITGIKDVEIEKDGKREILQEGNVNMIFDAWTTVDSEFRWEKKPLFYFLRNMFERTIFKFHTDRHIDELVSDTHILYNNVKAHLELHKF